MAATWRSRSCSRWAGLMLRADNGRAVNTIPDAFLPSWAPVGGRLAFYVRSRGHALHCIESPTEHPRKLLDVEAASQAPIWARDGESIAVVARRSNLKARDAGADLIELLRVQLDTSVVETIRSLSADAGPNRDRPIEGISIAFDRDGENLFCSAPVEGRLNQITWYHPRDGAVFKKFSILDPSITTGSLSFSADGRTLAARAVLADRSTAPVFDRARAQRQRPANPAGRPGRLGSARMDRRTDERRGDDPARTCGPK